MKKFFLPLMLLFLGLNLGAQSICVPDTTLADTVIISPLPFDAELRPEAGILDTACLNTYFETTFHVRIPDTVGTIAITGVDLEPEGAIGNLPMGLEYACNPPSCSFPADSTSCLQIFGTPTNSAEVGMHDLTLAFVFKTSLLDLPITYPDMTGLLPETAQGNYFLFVKEEGSENCFAVSTDDYLQQNLSLKNSPNPFSGLTDIQINSFINDQLEFRVSDLMGRVVHREITEVIQGDNVLTFDGSALPEGIYLYSLSNEKGRISNKMIVNR